VDGDEHRPVTNVVMMGMGEPLNNFEPVVAAMSIMLDDFAYGLSRRRVTLDFRRGAGTSAAEGRAAGGGSAVSLHAPNDGDPQPHHAGERCLPDRQLLEACASTSEVAPRDFITFET